MATEHSIRYSPLAIRVYSIMTSGSPNSTGWPSSTRNSVTVPARGGGRRHCWGDADVARNPQPEARTFDLDLGETGLVQQKCEFANKRAVAAGELCGCFIVRLARHALDPELSAG